MRPDDRVRIVRRRFRNPLAFTSFAALIGLFAVIVAVTDASACAVCYGDPESPMTKGIAAGIWVLLGCIGTLLVAFGGLFLHWMQRSRRLRSQEQSSDTRDSDSAGMIHA